MKKRFKLFFWLAVALQIILLGGMAGREYYTLAFGKTLILDTLPYDPWDYFRGNYLRLNYRAGEIDLKNIKNEFGSRKLLPEQKIVVYFKPGDPAVPVLIGKAPKPKDDLIPLQARVKYVTEAEVNLEYGIESYYIPEEAAHRERELTGDGGLKAVVAVDNNGHPVIRHLIFKGKKLRF